MGAFRNYMDRIERLFSRGGPLERFSALYEVVDTFIYTPADVTAGAPHVRDGIDLKRLMIIVVFAGV